MIIFDNKIYVYFARDLKNSKNHFLYYERQSYIQIKSFATLDYSVI